jgi:hypothetical protein
MDNIKVNKISEENTRDEESPVRNSSNENFGETQVEDLNCSNTMLVCSAVKLRGVAKRNVAGYGKGKVAQASEVTSEVAKVLNLSSTSLSQVSSNGGKQYCEGYNGFSTLNMCKVFKQEVLT